MVTRSILRPVLRPVTRAVSDTIRGFNHRSLFASGEQGIWLDPSDFSTLFQDAAGTTPVTAVGQPVGLALDKRLGLALGAELVTNGGFDSDTAWTNSSTGTGTAVISGGVLTLTGTDASNRGRSYQALAVESGKMYRVTLAKTGAAASVWVGTSPGGSGVAAADAASSSFVFLATAATVYLMFLTVSAGGTAVFDNISVRELPGNHASQTTSASRPTLQQDANGCYYLSFDGTDDGMETPSIDFTGTDKMTVWAGAKSNSAAANGTLVELSTIFGAGNPGSMAVLWPRLPYAVNFGLAGTGAASRSTSAVADTGPRVISCAFDISSALTVDEIKPRVNGAEPSLLTIDAGPAGTGNYGNYPLYIGRRGGTTLPFNGRIYQLIIRGAESNAGQIAATEAWCNSKTRAY